MKLGKRAMMDDLFDFLFTVMASFFLLVFIGVALSGSITSSNQKALSDVGDFNRLDSAVNNLRVQIHEQNDLQPGEIEEKIVKSQVLGGKTITSCQDYFNEVDCNKDILNLYDSIENTWCSWDSDKCQTKKTQVDSKI